MGAGKSTGDADGVGPDANPIDRPGDVDNSLDVTRTVGPQQRSSPRASNAPPRHKEGDRIGRYMVLERLGRGGMGVVYKSWDPELQRTVALKLLSVGGDSESQAESWRSRLIQEARALAQLSHPNIVAVHDVGTHGGEVFVAMEYVDGRTLREWLAEGPHDRSEVLGVLGAAGRGLAAAHRAGLVHRDFKPDNVMLGADGRVRVLDFGLVQEVARAPGDPTPLSRPAPVRSPDASSTSSSAPDSVLSSIQSIDTASIGPRKGEVVGTPRYMSPEQHRGLLAEPSSDQYSFCLVLYEALYGEKAVKASSVAGIRERVLTRDLAVPERRGVPRHLQRALVRGLRRAPDERFPDMDELLAVLAWDPAARRRKLGVAAAIVALPLAMALGWMRAAERDEQRCRNAGETISEAWNDGARDRLAAAFSQTSAGFAVSSQAFVEETFDEYARTWRRMQTRACTDTFLDRRQSDRRYDAQSRCLARRKQRLAALVDVLGRGEVQLEKAVEAARRLPGLAACADDEYLDNQAAVPDDPALAERVEVIRRQLDRADAQLATGQYALGLELADLAVADARAAGFEPAVAEALFSKARLQMRARVERAADAAWESLDEAGRLAAASGNARLEAQIATTRLRAGRNRKLSRESLDLVIDRGRDAVARAGGAADLTSALELDIATTYWRQGRYDEARDRYEWVLDERIGRLGAAHIDVGTVLVGLGNLQHEIGEYRSALGSLRRGLAIQERAYGDRHPILHGALQGIARGLLQLGRVREAKPVYERQLALLTDAYGPEHSALAYVQLGVASVHIELGEYEQGVEMARKALAGWTRELGADHPRLGYAYLAIGNALLGTGKPGEASEVFERAWELSVAKNGPRHPFGVFPLTGMARAAFDRGQLDEAETLYRRADALAREASGERHSARIDTLAGLGNALLKKNKPREAVEAFALARQLDLDLGGEPTAARVELLVSLGEAQRRSGDRERAAESLKRALSLELGEVPPRLTPVRERAARLLSETLGDQARATRNRRSPTP